MEQIRQRWWVVVVVAALGVLVAAASSVLAHPTYAGRSTLVLSVHAPDQDALMVVGYMTIFNDPATITRLRTTTKIPEDVTFEARTVAASPILTIKATADDPKVAQDAAYDMAVALRADITASQLAGTDGYIADLERQLAEIPPWTPPVGRMSITPPCRTESTRRGHKRAINFSSCSHAPASPRTHRGSRRDSCKGPRVD